MKQRAFTIIELLVSLFILATISIVAYTSYSGHMKTVNNATRISTIDSLHLSLSDYLVLKNTLPEPNSNYIAYDERGTYMHSSSGSYGSGVYGVSGHVTYDFLPAGYVNFEATDPESRQFYGYGKSLSDEKNPVFDVAAALYDEKTGGYKTYIRGTYQKSRLASLIRSYSSSNFVSQDSTENLPYNPYERKVTATVSNFSGSLTLANSNGTIASIISPATYTGELNAGDIITLGTGSTALLHISDGSELSLGSTGSQTILDLNTLTYSDDNNLVSQVALWLESGEVWVEAPHLRTEADSTSDFSIQTDSAVAAVRGTVFGMTKNPITNTTSISLKVGKIEVQKITTDMGKTTNSGAFTDKFTSGATGGFVLDSTNSTDIKSYMIVPEGGAPIKLDGITNDTGVGTFTGTLTPSEIDKKINHPPFSLGYRPKAYKIEFSTGAMDHTGILSVTYNNPGADSYELYFSTGFIYANEPFPNPVPPPSYAGSLTRLGPVTITGAFAYDSTPNTFRHYYLRVCYHGQCSAPDIKTLGWDVFSFQNFKVWGEKRKSVAETEFVAMVDSSCPTSPSEPGFWTTGCLTGPNSGLVAYAPYDTEGDYTLYQSGASYGSPEWSGGNLSFSGVAEGTGVIVGLPSDYLRYNLGSLGLGNNFSIEMSVRGSALKIPGWPYFLATTDTPNKYLLWLYGWKLYFGTNIGNAVSKTISELGTQIQDTDFYRITAKTTIIGNELTIKNAAWTAIFSGTWTYVPTFNNGKMYIWSDYTPANQWNDIIDSIKIYQYQ